MPFTPKAWQNYAAGGTPLNAAALTDLEQRLSDYSDINGDTLWMPAGALDQTVDRNIIASTQTLVTGTLILVGGCVLRAGQAVTSITFLSGNIAGATLTNQWFSLVKQTDLSVLAKTVDDTSTAWAANTAKTLNLSPQYTPSSTTAVYLGCLVTATTPPNLRSASSNTQGMALAPALAGTSTTGLTNPASLGATTAAVSVFPQVPYAYCS